VQVKRLQIGRPSSPRGRRMSGVDAKGRAVRPLLSEAESLAAVEGRRKGASGREIQTTMTKEDLDSEEGFQQNAAAAGEKGREKSCPPCARNPTTSPDGEIPRRLAP
jgi:hypothetical protein